MIQKSMTTPLAACCLLLAASAHALCLQFDASSPATLTTNGNAVTAWVSIKGGVTLMPIHGASNGWSAAILQPAPGKSSVSFRSQDGISVPSPLAFHGTEATQKVAYVFAIVRSQTPRHRMTLLDAPVDVRLETGNQFQEEQLGNTATYAINGHGTPTFLPSDRWQTVEVTFQTPVAINALYLGGSVPNPAWKRNFNGEISELVLLPAQPAPEQRNALLHYARAKWGARTDCDPLFTSGTTLRTMGMDTGDTFTALLRIR